MLGTQAMDDDSRKTVANWRGPRARASEMTQGFLAIFKLPFSFFQICIWLHWVLVAAPWTFTVLLNAIPFSCCMHACVLRLFSRVQLFATPWTVARQAPLSMGFVS